MPDGTQAVVEVIPPIFAAGVLSYTGTRLLTKAQRKKRVAKMRKHVNKAHARKKMGLLA